MITAKLILLGILHSLSVNSWGVDTTKIDIDEALCMAQNVYHEAKSEDLSGQYAVAHATLNRVNDPRFPKTVCEVVKQAKIVTSSHKQCAFSWYCKGDSGNVPVRDKNGNPNYSIIEQFEVASIVAIRSMSGVTEDTTNGATHFHNPSLSQPLWKNQMTRTLRLGNHDFYKLPPTKVKVFGEE